MLSDREDQQRLAAALLVMGLSGFLLMYIHVKKEKKHFLILGTSP